MSSSGRDQPDYYKILQVDPSAEPEVIKAAYLNLAKKYHADHSNSPNAHERMVELNQAYELLRDPDKKAEYDRGRSAAGTSHSHDVVNDPPEPVISPDGLNFYQLAEGETTTRFFTVDNIGGPASEMNIDFVESTSQFRIVNIDRVSVDAPFPITVTIEASTMGMSAGQSESNYLVIELDGVRAHAAIELSVRDAADDPWGSVASGSSSHRARAARASSGWTPPPPAATSSASVPITAPSTTGNARTDLGACLGIGMLLGGLVGYALHALIPNTGTNLYVSAIAGIVATIMAIAAGAKLGNCGGSIAGFILAVIAGPVLKGVSLGAYSTGAWATIYAGILCFAAGPLAVGMRAKKSGALIGVVLGTLGLTAAIVVAGEMAADTPPAAFQSGTIATCMNVRGWRNFTAKTEFKVNDPICGYAEALNINRFNQVDVSYTFTVFGPNRTAYATHSERCLLRDSSVTACEATAADIRLPANAPPGAYTLQVLMRNNLTGQVAQGSSAFVVTSGTRGGVPGNSAALLEAVASQKPFVGEAADTSQRWPATVSFESVDAATGKFTGQVEWTSLNTITKMEGVVSGSALSFTETEYIRRGPALLDVTYNLELVDANKLEGHWTYQNGGRTGTAWFTLPVIAAAGQATGALKVQALPGAEVLVDGVNKGSTDAQGILVVPDLPVGSHQLAVRKNGYRDGETIVEITSGQTQAATSQLELVVGKFSVQTLPGAAVFLDAAERGSTDYQGYLAIYDVPAGAHKLLVKKAGLPDFASDVMVSAGENETFVARMLGDLSRLNIQTMPSAEVYIDGYSRGAADGQGKLTVSDLPAGSHAISVRKSGSEIGQVTVNFGAGDRKDLRVMPSVSVGFLTVRSNRPDTTFQISGEGAPNNSIMKFNNSIVDNPFPLGTYIISASAAGMKSETRTVVIEIGNHVLVDFALGSDH